MNPFIALLILPCFLAYFVYLVVKGGTEGQDKENGFPKSRRRK